MLFLALIYVSFISLGLPDSMLGASWPLAALELQVPVESAGLISMTISTGTVLSSLMAHKAIRRFGTGMVTLTSVALTAVALLGFSLSPSFIWLVISAVPLGLGAGAVDSGLNEFVAEHYKAHHMNWLHSFWGVGAMLGPVIVSAMAKSGLGWRNSFFTVALIQALLVLVLAFSVPAWNRLEGVGAHKHSSVPGAAPHGLVHALKTKGVFWALLSFFLYTSVESSFMLWGASYLVNARDIEPALAAGWVSTFFIGITIGRALAGFISLRINNERLIRLGAVLALTGLVILWLPLNPLFALPAYILAGLGMAPIFPALLHQTPVYFGKKNAQATMGLQMAFAYIGVMVMPPLFGRFFAWKGFNLMPAVLLICAIGMLLCTIMLAKTAGRVQTD